MHGYFYALTSFPSATDAAGLLSADDPSRARLSFIHRSLAQVAAFIQLEVDHGDWDCILVVHL